MTTWPFRPNWTSRYRETYTHLTEIITSDSGREQRRAWRLAARRSVSYQALVQRDGFHAMRRALAQQDQTLDFPSERERANLASDVAQGSTSATLDGGIPAWAVPGRRVVFEDRVTKQRQVRTIGSVGGGALTLSPAERPWAGGTRVMPVLIGRLAQSIRGSASTNAVVTVPITLEVEPGTEFEQPGVAEAVLNGVEVFLHKPNWADRVEVEVIDPTEWADNQMGVRTPYRTVAFGTEIMQSEHMIRSEADVSRVLGLFLRARGRCGEFYRPTWTNDFNISAAVPALANTFVVAGHEFFDAYADDRIHSAFQIQLNTGDLLRFRIDEMVKSTSGDARTLITTTAATPVALSPDDIESISWLLMSRFASDELVIEWVTDKIATAIINTQSTENLA